MTSVLAEALPQEDPQVAKAAFSIRRTTCRANGIRQFYLEAGVGPPVILLHGFPETSFAWRFQIPALARHYRVIAPDLRGYGETDKPSKGYDKRTMANDVVELLKALGVGRVALVGHDRGARVATRLVKDRPELVDRLVVMDNVPTRIVAREMTAKVAREYAGKGLFVRSSSNSEDLPNFSGAGLYTTVPNVRGDQELIDAIRKVWASLWNFEAYEARERAGVDHSKIFMAVLLQEGINSESSGVMISTSGIWRFCF